MIDLYAAGTSNGMRARIVLEECGLPYTLKPVNIGKGEQFEPSFLAIAPNNRMPAIVDHAPPGGGEPVSIFESGQELDACSQIHPRMVQALRQVCWLRTEAKLTDLGKGTSAHL